MKKELFLLAMIFVIIGFTSAWLTGMLSSITNQTESELVEGQRTGVMRIEIINAYAPDGYIFTTLRSTGISQIRKGELLLIVKNSTVTKGTLIYNSSVEPLGVIPDMNTSFRCFRGESVSLVADIPGENDAELGFTC